jgi:hypothetical protein
MDGRWLDVGRVLEQGFQDVDGFPHPARDEVAEQGDVGVRDVVVGDPAIAAVADRVLGQEAVLGQLVLGPVRRGRATGAQTFGRSQR